MESFISNYNFTCLMDYWIEWWTVNGWRCPKSFLIRNSKTNITVLQKMAVRWKNMDSRKCILKYILIGIFVASTLSLKWILSSDNERILVRGDLIRMVQVFEINCLMMLSNVELETSMMIHIKLVIESSLNWYSPS